MVIPPYPPKGTALGDNNIPVPMLSFQQSIAMGSTVFRVLLLYSVIHPRRAHVFCGPSPHAPQGSVGEGKARGVYNA